MSNCRNTLNKALCTDIIKYCSIFRHCYRNLVDGPKDKTNPAWPWQSQQWSCIWQTVFKYWSIGWKVPGLLGEELQFCALCRGHLLGYDLLICPRLKHTHIFGRFQPLYNQKYTPRERRLQEHSQKLFHNGEKLKTTLPRSRWTDISVLIKWSAAQKEKAQTSAGLSEKEARCRVQSLDRKLYIIV